MMADGAFATMAAQDARHLARFGRNGYIVPGLPTRAEKLADAILRLDAIAPALSRRYLDKRWLDRGAMSVLYGEFNVGKTFLALDLAMPSPPGRPGTGRA